MSLFGKREEVPFHPETDPLKDEEVTPENLKKAFGHSSDLTERILHPERGGEITAFFIDGLVDSEQISSNVIRPILQWADDSPERTMTSVVWNLNALERDNIADCAADLINGCCVIIYDGKALSFEAKGGEKRSVSEPIIENVVKGAKEGFVETLRTNTSLVRRRLRSPQLRILEAKAGRLTKTRIEILYIEGLTNPEFVTELEERVKSIDVDGVISAAVLEEYIIGDVKTVFPLLQFTDLCDRFCEGLLAGRIGLIAEGIPIGYLLPATMPQLMKAPEDEANNYIVASVIRALRYFGLAVTLLLPGFYVAVATFHQEMIPYTLMKSIVESKQGVPFSSSVEVIGMLIAFEILQEAGLRLPKTIGQTVSIIGALIVGQSAVEAKIFSPVVVIVVAVAGIMGYLVPNQDFAAAMRIWRFMFAVCAALLGMFALALAGMVLIYHLASIENFNVPYLAPLAGRGGHYPLRNTVFRARMKKTQLRPKELDTLKKRSRA
ncbi:MAG: spore germination protein [Oscillospiraceae bacterium]|jgi:spore germination protein KA